MTSLEKTFNFIKHPLVMIFSIFLIIVTYLVVDRPLAIYFHQFNLRENMQSLNILTALGFWQIYVCLFLIAGLYFRYLRKNSVYEKQSWYLLGCILVPNMIGLILKVTLGRARPELLFSSHEFGFYGFKFTKLYWSLPSGHTVTVAALAYGLGNLVPRYFYAFLFVALLVASSRVLLYYHYLSDVMVSFYFSLLIAGLFSHRFKKIYK